MSGGNKMKIFHDLADIQEGEEIILTLQDRTILDEKGDLNDEDEGGILLNQEIFERQKAEHDSYVKSNVKRLGNVQTAHLDEKYGDVDRKSLLPHYDEKKFERHGIALDEEGQFRVEQMQQLDLIKQKLKSKKQNVESLDSLNDKQVASEYKEEKRAAKPVFKKKKSNQNGKRTIDESKSLLEFLEENAETTEEFRDRKKVKTDKHEQVLRQQLLDQKNRRDNYDQALQNSKDELAASQKRLNPLEEEDEEKKQERMNMSIFWEEDDQMLQLSIEKERIAQQQKQIGDSSKQFMTNEDRLQSLLAESQEVEEDIQNQEAKKAKQFAVPMSKLNKSKNTVSEVTEINFSEDQLRFIETDENRKTEHEFVYKSETKKALKDTQKGTTSVVNVSMPTERLKGKRYHDHIQEEEEFQKKLQEDTITDQEYKQILNELEDIGLHKEELGQGLSGFLTELKDRGILLNDNLEYSGRSLDLKPHEDGTLTTDTDRIQLEYRDDTGKIMTKRQAFRYLCWKFHGKGPSRNKMEKLKIKELEKEQQRVKQLNEDSIIMKNLKSSQKLTNQPYLVLQKKN